MDLYFRCNQCNAHVKSQHSLTRHVKRVHERSGEPGHECGECGKRFFEREDLTKHVARHAKQATLPKCDTCAKTFGTERLKESHKCKKSGPEPKVCLCIPTGQSCLLCRACSKG